VKAAVLGAAGYVGGELVRILLGHPALDLVQVTSTRQAGQAVTTAHPNLRGLTDLRFTPHDQLRVADVVFAALPHGVLMQKLDAVRDKAGVLVDLSADFRLADQAAYRRYYDAPHAAPDAVDGFVTGCPELFRDRLRTADAVAVPGCMATAAILASAPAARAGLGEGPLLVDARTGSSGSGVKAGPAGHHPERSGVVRVFAPSGHRHEPEIEAVVGLPAHMTATAVEAVRGVQVVIRAPLRGTVSERDLRVAYHTQYAGARFVRIVSANRGLYRLPEPKILLGSNFCDVGFALDERAGQVLLIGALDNLVKGSAGNAVQCVNVRLGLDERAGLEFPGLHPI
jgi:N-acetyl-gamma-glutamyl-phosphate/LysW-gamma-L-alpha-aminoadipyl-6-phosphate reductase